MGDAYSVMGFLCKSWLVLLRNSISVKAKNCQWLFFYYASAVQVIGCNRCVNQWFGENDDDHARHVAPKLRKRPSAGVDMLALSEQAVQVLFQDDYIPEDNSDCRLTSSGTSASFLPIYPHVLLCRNFSPCPIVCLAKRHVCAVAISPSFFCLQHCYFISSLLLFCFPFSFTFESGLND